MTQDYPKPIAPPPELVQQWASEWMQQQSLNRDNFMATRASQYGADQELEACCEWLDKEGWSGESRQLRAARRPKPPSLKEQALETLRYPKDLWSEAEVETIRRALEQLDD